MRGHGRASRAGITGGHHATGKQVGEEMEAAGMTLPGRRTVRVLALEDDADTREVFTLFLGPEEGFTLDLCDTVDSCLARLRAALTKPYDVVVMDILLSQGHNGLEVLDAARADPSLVVPPIVVCTALSPTTMASHKPALDGFDTRVVFKPFNLDDLQAAILAAAGPGSSAL